MGLIHGFLIILRGSKNSRRPEGYDRRVLPLLWTPVRRIGVLEDSSRTLSLQDSLPQAPISPAQLGLCTDRVYWWPGKVFLPSSLALRTMTDL